MTALDIDDLSGGRLLGREQCCAVSVVGDGIFHVMVKTGELPTTRVCVLAGPRGRFWRVAGLAAGVAAVSAGK